jgi:hypothetical protein
MFALTRYDSVLRALKDASVFSSASGVMMNDDMNQVLRGNTLCSDGADHERLRRVIGKPLTPTALKSLREEMTSKADRLVDGLVAKGTKRRKASSVTRHGRHLRYTSRANRWQSRKMQPQTWRSQCPKQETADEPSQHIVHSLGNPGYDHEPDNRKDVFDRRIDVERHESDDERHDGAKDLADQGDVCIRRVIERFVRVRGYLDCGHGENLFAANACARPRFAHHLRYRALPLIRLRVRRALSSGVNGSLGHMGPQIQCEWNSRNDSAWPKDGVSGWAWSLFLSRRYDSPLGTWVKRRPGISKTLLFCTLDRPALG